MNNEPVAWISKFCLQYLEEGYDTKAYPKENEHANIPLYTHPEKTLTDEEIKHLQRECIADAYAQAHFHGDKYINSQQAILKFARAILRKANEK